MHFIVASQANRTISEIYIWEGYILISYVWLVRLRLFLLENNKKATSIECLVNHNILHDNNHRQSF